MVNHTDPIRMDNKKKVEPKRHTDRSNAPIKPEVSCDLSIQEEAD